MWDCGSARFCVCVVAGTGLSMCLSPDCWLLMSLSCGLALLAVRARRGWGVTASLRDAVTAALLISTVGLAASERITAQSTRVAVRPEGTVTLRGEVCGLAQASGTGVSVLVNESGRKVLVRLRSLPDDILPGDTLTVTGNFRTSLGPRNCGGYSEAAYLFQQGVWHVMQVPGFLRPSVKKAVKPKGVTGTYVAPVRRWIRESVRKRMVGEERAFLLALILGERGEFSDETRAAFRDSGLVHILSVSGLHTALVGLVALILLKGLRLRERAALAGAVALVWFYCALSGFQPPTVRAALMLTWVTASRLLGRSNELMAPLFSSCAALLVVSPRFFWDPGFQLSYLAAGSIIMSAKLAGRVREVVRLPERAWKYVGSTAMTTCVAQLGVLPLLALQFGSVSMVAVPANLVGIPLASGGLVCGFCALALEALFPWVAGFAFDVTWLLLRLCNLVAGHASAAPGAILELSRPHVVEVVLFLVSFFAALNIAAVNGRGASKRRRLALVLAVACATTQLARFAGFSPAGLVAGRCARNRGCLTVDFLDVGQGDAILLRLPDGRSVLVDAGDAREGWDCAQKVLAPYLRAKNIRSVDAAVVTHFHSDHAGGLPWLIAKGKVGRVVTSGADTTSCLWRVVALASLRRRIRLEATGNSGRMPGPTVDATEFGGPALIRFLHPSGRTTADTSSSTVNDSSVVCVVEHGSVRFILTGDVDGSVLDTLSDELASTRQEAEADGAIQSWESQGGGREAAVRGSLVTVVKAPHHGARATLSERFVEAVRPDFVVFSVGRGNRFGHPSPLVVECYRRAGAKVFRTDEVGCVSFEVRVEGSVKSSRRSTGRELRRDAGASVLTVTTADPTASHPFILKAKGWRAERTLRALTLLSSFPGGRHE